MSQYVFLQVKKVIRETAEAVTIVFTKPTLWNSYKSGQFLTLIIEISGQKLRRSYSLSSSPYADQDWAVSVKKIQGGKMSTYLVDKVKAGDIIETMAPAGVFTYEPSPSQTNDLVLIGAGSGITPLYSILTTALKAEKNSKVYLVYANRNEENVILKEGLAQLKADYSERFFYNLVYSKPLQSGAAISGRLDKDKILKVLENFKTIQYSKGSFFVCGPQGMMDEAFAALGALKISSGQIHKENFASAAPSKEESAPTSSSEEVIEVDVKYNKQIHTIKVAPGQTILDAAQDQGIDLPYSCQSGMCTACMGKCLTGQVKMVEPDGLSENEIKQGFVLTCVSRPLTSDVFIEID